MDSMFVLEDPLMGRRSERPRRCGFFDSARLLAYSMLA
jgi:hypothetical protein